MLLTAKKTEWLDSGCLGRVTERTRRNVSSSPTKRSLSSTKGSNVQSSETLKLIPYLMRLCFVVVCWEGG